MKRIFALSVALFALLLSPAFAEDESGRATYEDAQSMPEALKEKLRYGTKFEEQYVENVLQPLRSYGRDRKSIDKEDIERIKARNLKARRSQQYTQMLRFDLDYDGKITGAELRKVFMDEQGERATVEGCNDLADRQMQKHDVDGDGEISLQEMAAVTDSDGNSNRGETSNLEKLLALDPDGDGTLTVAELEPMARKAFATVDADGDGQISEEESRAFNESRRATRFETATNFRDKLEKLKTSCAAPQAKPGDKVVFLNAYQGAALSTVSVAGQEEETTVVRVNISKGEGKLHIVAAAGKPVIWQVQGDAARISTLVAAGPAARGGNAVKAGVAGVDAAKVVFVKLRDCIPVVSQDASSVEGIQAVAAVKAMAGAAVELPGHAVSAYRFDVGATVDSAKAEAAGGEGQDAVLWALVLRGSPGGIADLKGVTVNAGGKAEPYDVLPEEAGLAQLVKEGKIVKSGDGASEFKIVKEFARYPAGLTGAHAVRFVLAKDIKPPMGDPGHSCVIQEETGQPLNARIANNCNRR